jgi:hypothetical protein
MKGPVAGAALWAERYEVLRQYVLEGRQRLPSQPLGLALWVAQGMAGWLGQWRRYLEPAPAPAAGPPRGEPEGGPSGLTVLLAQITLQHLEGRVGL